MAKVSDKELNECIAQAITEVLKEDWEDDIVNAAMNDKRAQKAYFKKTLKNTSDADDEIIAQAGKKEEEDNAEEERANAIDAPDTDDEDGGEEEVAQSNGAYSDVRGMSYEELVNLLNTEKRGSAIFRAATREKMDRDAIMKDKKDILAGELVMPYGWKFDETGYPVRTHEFKHADSEGPVDADAFNGLNHHWLKPRMSVHGEELDNQGVGIPDANFWE